MAKTNVAKDQVCTKSEGYVQVYTCTNILSFPCSILDVWCGVLKRVPGYVDLFTTKQFYTLFLVSRSLSLPLARSKQKYPFPLFFYL